MDFPLSNLTSGSTYILQNAGTGAYVSYIPSNDSLACLPAPVHSDLFAWTPILHNSSASAAPYYSIQLANTANCLGVADNSQHSVRVSPCSSADLPQWKILALIEGPTPPALVVPNQAEGLPAAGQLAGYVIAYADGAKMDWILGVDERDTSKLVVSPVTPAMHVSLEGKGDASNVTLGGGDFWGLSLASLEGKPGGISVLGAESSAAATAFRSSSSSSASTTSSPVTTTAAGGIGTTLGDAEPTNTVISTTVSKTGAASTGRSGVSDSFFWATVMPFFSWLIII